MISTETRSDEFWRAYYRLTSDDISTLRAAWNAAYDASGDADRQLGWMVRSNFSHDTVHEQVLLAREAARGAEAAYDRWQHAQNLLYAQAAQVSGVSLEEALA